jgi:hypothetical protein
MKRGREFDTEKLEVIPNTSLQNHPLNCLIPTEITVPFTLPVDINILSDSISFSQDDINDRSLDGLFSVSQLRTSEDPDLKYVKFKKPYLHDKNNKLNIEPSTTEAQSQLVKLSGKLAISPVTKDDYFKVSVPFEKDELTIPIEDDHKLIDKIIDMFDIDYKIEKLEPTETKNILHQKEVKLIEPEVHPEFTYDLKVSQSALISQVKSEFIQLVNKICRNEHSENLDVAFGQAGLVEEQDKTSDYDDLFSHYSVVFTDELTIARSEILASIKSKLINMIQTKTENLVEIEIYLRLFNYCANVIKESTSIEWERICESEEIYNTDEYQSAAEAVMQCCSIMIILYTINPNGAFLALEKGLVLVTDFISSFGSVIKLLFRQESFNELPEFFIPLITQFSQVLITLNQNFNNVPFDESLLTRIEYLAFDIIFTDIMFNKERSNLNISLEDLRSIFAETVVSIYLRYEDQRTFIFNEIIENISSLNPLKSKARNYRLKSGASVQLISFLILSLLQCHHGYGKDFNFSQWDFLSIDHSTKAKAVELKEIEHNFWSSINQQTKSLLKATETFAQSFFRKIVSIYTPSVRKIAENFISDFISMLDMPDFPVSPILLDSIISVAIHACETTENSLTGAYGLFFEITGIIASKILILNSENVIVKFDSEIDISTFSETADQYIHLLSYLKLKNDVFSFDLISMIFLFKLHKMELSIDSMINTGKNSLIGNNLKEKKKLLRDIKICTNKVMELPFQDKRLFETELLSDDQIKNMYRSVLLSQDLFFRYDDILSFIVLSFNNPKIKARTLAVKNLTLLINKEPRLLEDSNLRNLIKQRLNEPSASIIDAVLDLLLKALECKVEYIDEYYDIVAQKITEPSINVKRKSMNLIKYMFLNTNEHEIKIRLCRALLSQLDDEEDRTVDMACLNLCELLFLCLDTNSGIKQDSVLVEAKTDEIIFVLCGIFLLGPQTWNRFERFLSEKVIYSSDFNKDFTEDLKCSLRLLVDSMLNLITDSTEKLKSLKGGQITVESIMGVLSTFVKCDPTLISQHQLLSLQPYIINDYMSTEICFYALQILNLALNYYKTLNRNFIDSCKDSIMKRLTKFNSRELDQGIQCVWKLFLIDDDTTGISKACVSSLKMILSYIVQLKDSIKNFKPDPAVPRLLYLIGNFGRYCNFERDRIIFESAQLGLHEREPISVLLLKYLLKFCDSSMNKPLRKIAIKNTLNICVSYPKLFFSVPVAKLIESSFKKKDLAITNIIIGAFLMFLENEELQMIKKNGLDVKRSNSIKIDIAVFHGYSSDYVNDGICSTLVHKYLNNILETCLEKDIQNALNSIKFLRMVIKFGFSNPRVCFPTVVALECAETAYIRHMAIELHKFLYNKFETLIESTYSEAIKTTVIYFTKVYHLKETENCKSFLKVFLKIVRERNSKQRVHKFLYAFLKSLRNVSFYKFQKMNKDGLKSIENHVVFLCVNINEMEFANQYEILTVINYIEKIILMEETIFGDQFNLLMDMFGDDDDDDEKLKYLVMAKALLSLNCLIKCLIANYSVSPELILRFQESSDKKEFYTSITRTDSNRFFVGEIKDLLTKPASNQLTLLHNELLKFGKN